MVVQADSFHNRIEQMKGFGTKCRHCGLRSTIQAYKIVSVSSVWWTRTLWTFCIHPGAPNTDANMCESFCKRLHKRTSNFPKALMCALEATAPEQQVTFRSSLGFGVRRS